MAIDRFNVKISANGKSKDTGGPGRTIWNFEDLRRRVEGMPWDAEVKKSFLKRVSKYPEASLDYVWKNLNTFLNQAMKDVFGATTGPVAPNVVRETKVQVKQEAKPKISRPEFSLFEEEVTDDNNRTQPLPG